MSRIERFEDLVVWQQARELTKLAYFITRNEAFDHSLANDIRQTTVMIAAKVASAFEMRGTRISLSSLNLAKAAANGFRLQWAIVHEQQIITDFEYTELVDRAVEIRQLLFELEYTFELWYPQRDDSQE